MATVNHMNSAYTWWRHQVETFSALLALWAGNSLVIGEFPSQRPVMLSWCFLWSVHWINGWVNNSEAGYLRRHHAHNDLIVMNLVQNTRPIRLGSIPCLLLNRGFALSRSGVPIVGQHYLDIPCLSVVFDLNWKTTHHCLQYSKGWCLESEALKAHFTKYFAIVIQI